ncbi:MAG: preprotein translocase subunit SecA [Clostridia bacterium]|nr:preprotein translocase subunit SecA [Clostridia bacterium]
MGIFEKVFGDYSGREIKRIKPTVEKVLSYEDEYKKLTDSELRAKTDEFKERIQRGETLDDILPEAFATVREASDRVLGMRHFPVQIIGGIVLHQGRIAEMKTGEGKTLVATLPAYLNALTGEGVHIVTVNDYLARRDSEWMGKVYRFLGLTVGLIVNGLKNEDRQKAYAADITYGTNNEMGFDYLRDNMVIYKEQMVQRGHAFAIVDEVDSILIDEARTPLIISGMGTKSTTLYETVNAFVRGLKSMKIVELDTKELHDDVDADYIVDEKAKSVTLTARGTKKAEQAFGIENLADPENMTLSHHINQAIRAWGVMTRDIDYVVKDGQVLIVDEFTGRIMIGRRYSDGLHQAIEAKEGVKVERENKTLATITFQNYFRLYKKLSGMTGTAKTEESEFQTIYSLDVVEIPTNKPLAREDMPDRVYKTEDAKFRAVVSEIAERHATGQPVLVGTISIEKSEILSAMLKKSGIKHNVLNAKHHDKEAMIVAQAGQKDAVTIATNMAGRGTDIVLGGNAEYMAKSEMEREGFDDAMIAEATGFAETDNEEIIAARKRYTELFDKHKDAVSKEHDEVVSLGGLCIIGTERHESRRIDNQLRGRAGRQGDPGRSVFYISLQDDLMRLFGSERLEGVVNTLGLGDDDVIEHRMLSRAIENAQKKVEGNNFQSRKYVLQYDDVMNKQREIIYGQRRQVLDGEDIKDVIVKMANTIVEEAVAKYTAGSDYAEEWNRLGLLEYFNNEFAMDPPLEISEKEFNGYNREELTEKLTGLALQQYENKEKELTSPVMRDVERVILLRAVDSRWMDHIDEMDQLKHGIGLQAYGQHDPVIEYQYAGFDMFDEMIASIREDTVKYILRANVEKKIEREQVAKPIAATHGDGSETRKPVRKTAAEKVGRNDPCPCGSGKKYKKCCGQNE